MCFSSHQTDVKYVNGTNPDNLMLERFQLLSTKNTDPLLIKNNENKVYISKNLNKETRGVIIYKSLSYILLTNGWYITYIFYIYLYTVCIQNQK